MYSCNTRSKQPALTQASKRKTRGSKATIDNNEPVNDPPPAKSGGRKPLQKTVEADEGGEEATAEASLALKNTSRPVPRKKVAEVTQDPPPMKTSPLRTPIIPPQDPPHAETPPPPPAEAPSPHTKDPALRLHPILLHKDLALRLPPLPPRKFLRLLLRLLLSRSLAVLNEPEDPNNYLDKGSDYEETEVAQQFCHDRMRPHRCTPDMEGQDADDLEAFEHEISTEDGAKPKGKEKEGTQAPHKSGPIPNDAKEEAFALQATFRNGIEALAARIGKSPDTLYALIGEGAKVSRCTVSLWGVFEAWYASKGGLTKPKTMSAQDWAVVVAGEYKDYCKKELQEKWEDPMERAQLLEPMVEWYKEWYDDFIDEKKVDGTFHKIIAKTRDEFMHSAQLASQYHDLHCFGFIMNLHPDETGRTGSMMWGVTRAYELMKKK
ncbi:hypothetical protein DXG01_008616 [Tephrocybe rancida]|nr:hypothetical protein DXG01_008616 [Tephrocybe rancida]